MESNKTMKTKYISFVAMAAAALATSCSSDDIAELSHGGSQTVTLNASVNEGQTRVGMTKDASSTASFYWHKSDKIFVQTVSDGSYSGAEFAIVGDNAKDGDTSATFEGKVTGEVGGYAVYPCNEGHKFTGETTLTYHLPGTYTYTTVESNIFSKDSSYPTNPTNMPMLGTISGEDGNKSISFKCIGGLAVIRIDNMPYASGTLTFDVGQKLSGDFTVTGLSASDVKITTALATGDEDKVTFTFSGATKGQPGVFYLPMLQKSYNLITITIADDSGDNSSTVDYGTTFFEVTRGGVIAFPLYNVGGKIYKDQSRKLIGNNIFVDLGLSVLWAESNASKYGSGYYGDNLYQWNDVMSGQNDLNSFSSDWSSCSLPTQAQFEELINNCSWEWKGEWASGYNVAGYKITSNVTGYTDNSIFLPAAGYIEGYGSATDKSKSGYYWYAGGDDTYGGDTSYDSGSKGPCFCFQESSKEFTSSSYSCSVRAVHSK